MKVVALSRYGGPEVLALAERPKPVPGDGHILVRNRASSVGIGDLWARRFNTISPRAFSMPFPLWLLSRFAFGWSRPRIAILGAEFAGVVEATGPRVTQFQPGDEVFGFRGQALGAYAEYLSVPENGLVVRKPANVSFEEAATIPYGALTAMTLLRRAAIRPGQEVLILGASGRIGSFALQFARNAGATVTAVCGARTAEAVRALGADRVLDYARDDVTRAGRRYDLIFDIMNRGSFPRSREAMTERGIYLLASFKMRQVWQMLTSPRNGRRVICALSNPKQADLREVGALVEAGRLRTVVDRSFPLAEAAAAHAYLESGARTGHVALTIG